MSLNMSYGCILLPTHIVYVVHILHMRANLYIHTPGYISQRIHENLEKFATRVEFL